MVRLPKHNELLKFLEQVGRWLAAYGTLPDDTHTPSGLLKVADVARISFHILAKFFCPEFDVAGRSCGFPALWVAVPVATMNKQNGFPPRQHDVR